MLTPDELESYKDINKMLTGRIADLNENLDRYRLTVARMNNERWQFSEEVKALVKAANDTKERDLFKERNRRDWM